MREPTHDEPERAPGKPRVESVTVRNLAPRGDGTYRVTYEQTVAPRRR